MKLLFKKYFKTFLILLTAVSFGTVSSASDLHNCFCKTGQKEVKKIKSCCSDNEASETESHCQSKCSDSNNGCDNCKECRILKKDFDNTADIKTATINQITEKKIYKKETTSIHFFTNKPTTGNNEERPPGTHSELFISFLNLRI